MAMTMRKNEGLMDWVMAIVCRLKAARAQKVASRQMQVLETLALGPKKQLMLVSCGGLQFLVGTGAESVQTIVRVGPDVHHGVDGRQEWL